MDQEALADLFQRITQMFDTSALIAASELGLADHLADGSRSPAELARSLGVDEGALARLLDILTASNVVSRRPEGEYSLEPAGQFLRSDVAGSLRGFLRGCAPWLGSAAIGGGRAVRLGEPCFESVFGLPAWDYFAKNPEMGSIFNAAMANFASHISAPCLDSYDFTQVRHLVDVGGGTGQLGREVARRYPHLRATIFDQPHVAADAESAITAEGLADRCEVASGDFFVHVPPADCYTLRFVLHDWRDDDAISILRTCRSAIETGGRLLLFEVIRPTADGPHLARTLDWMILTSLTGKERTQTQYASLLSQSGFQVERVVPCESPMSVIDARPI